MRVVFVCKRYYTGKDVIRHRFGRLYELPTQLARLGHQVTVLCLDYRNDDPQKSFTEPLGSGSVQWIIVSMRDVFGMRVGAISKAIKAMDPEVVIGSSDIPCLWLARHLARRIGVPYVVDLYDNYESFGQARIPGFRHMLKSSIRGAAVLIVVSAALKEKVMTDYAPSGSVVIMNNGIGVSSFSQGDRLAARILLGLPSSARLIGTAGNLSQMKGLDTVYTAWLDLERNTENTYLVLAGRVDPKLPLPGGERVIYLGELLEQQVGQLFRALDVGVIPAHDSAFGRYCFPQKLFEMVACGLPIAAARVGAVEQVLQGHPEMLFTPGDGKSLLATVKLQLESPRLSDIKPMQWGELIQGIEPVIRHLVELKSHITR